jgi:hypothetical protein
LVWFLHVTSVGITSFFGLPGYSPGGNDGLIWLVLCLRVFEPECLPVASVRIVFLVFMLSLFLRISMTLRVIWQARLKKKYAVARLKRCPVFGFVLIFHYGAR